MNDLFSLGFFSGITILLISICLGIGIDIGKSLERSKMDNIIIIEKCGNKMVGEK